MTLQQFREALNPRFSFMEPVIDAVYYGIKLKKHTILHGPGGHAKSTIVEEALKLFVGEDAFYKDVYITNCAEDMDTTPIMGYDDIVKWQKEGVLEKVTAQTIFQQKKYAILEEGLDAPAALLTALKDPLMRGYLCINGECRPNTLESLFICTNVDPMKWAGKDNSKLALLQRFYFSVEVIWPDYSYKSWDVFFKKRGISTAVMAKFCEICHQNGWPISPRSAERMEEVYRNFGLEALVHFENMPAPVFQKLVDYEKNVPFIQEINLLQQELVVVSNITDPRERNVAAQKLGHKASKVKGIPVDGGYSGTLKNIILTSKEITRASLQEMEDAKKPILV